MPSSRLMIDLSFYPELHTLAMRQKVTMEVEALVEMIDDQNVVLRLTSVNVTKAEKLSTQERMARSLEKIEAKTSGTQTVL